MRPGHLQPPLPISMLQPCIQMVIRVKMVLHGLSLAEHAAYSIACTVCPPVLLPLKMGCQ